MRNKAGRLALSVGVGVALAVGIGLGGCSSSDSASSSSEKEKVVAQQKAAEEKAAKEKAEKEKAARELKEEQERQAKEEQAKKAEADKVAQEVKEELALQLIRDNFEGSMIVEFDKKEKTFKMTPSSPAFVIELAQVFEGTRSKKDWNNLVAGMAELSGVMQESLGNGYAITMQNPVNPENTILLVMDGVVIYDSFND